MEIHRKYIELLTKLLKEERGVLEAAMKDTNFQEDYDEMEYQLMLVQELQKQIATLPPAVVPASLTIE